MTKTRRRLLWCAGAAMLAMPALGQFGLGRKKDKEVKGNADGGGSSVSPAMSTADFIAYLAIATDLGMQGTSKLLDLYPPAKVEAIKQVTLQYNEAKSKEKPGEIGETRMKLASQAGEEAAKLDAQYALVDQERAKTLRACNSRLALMLVADAFAVAKLPSYRESLEADIKAISSNPMKATALSGLKRQLAVITVAGTALPSQIKSFGTVRGTAKKIAEAMKVTLPPDPAPESIQNVDSLKKLGESQDVEA